MKILTIGNSFTDSLAAYFQQVVESAGCKLHFERANHGGCELKRHWDYISSEERDHVYMMYQNHTARMRDILAREQWDVVTMQQASHDSWRPETFQPFADNIVEVVRKYAPDAEIVIQQTWSYRADDPRLMAGSEWNIDQTEMYNRLTENYRNLAKHLNARIIPTGYAVQLSRQQESMPFKNYDPALMNTLRWPDLPPQAGDVVGQMYWGKDAQTGEMVIRRDTIHLNKRGQYMQACVWFAMLYGHKTEEVTYVPDEISGTDAVFLRKVAQEAVDNFKQEKI